MPALIRAGDYNADLHTHTHASDGMNTIEEMAEAARARGYACLAICDHSRSSRQAGGLSIERLLEQIGQVRAANDRMESDFTILAGSEVDILRDGTLDYPDDVLAQLDWVVASVHSNFNLSPDKKWLIAQYEEVNTPPCTALYSTSGEFVANLAESDPSTAANLAEMFKFRSDDGRFDIYGILYKPRDFDPNKTYPVINTLYGGPNSRNRGPRSTA